MGETCPALGLACATFCPALSNMCLKLKTFCPAFSNIYPRNKRQDSVFWLNSGAILHLLQTFIPPHRQIAWFLFFGVFFSAERESREEPKGRPRRPGGRAERKAKTAKKPGKSWKKDQGAQAEHTQNTELDCCFARFTLREFVLTALLGWLKS